MSASNEIGREQEQWTTPSGDVDPGGTPLGSITPGYLKLLLPLAWDRKSNEQ